MLTLLLICCYSTRPAAVVAVVATLYYCCCVLVLLWKVLSLLLWHQCFGAALPGPSVGCCNSGVTLQWQQGISGQGLACPTTLETDGAIPLRLMIPFLLEVIGTSVGMDGPGVGKKIFAFPFQTLSRPIKTRDYVHCFLHCMFLSTFEELS